MIERLEQLLRSLIGLDASTLGRGAVERALRQRLKANSMDEEAYWSHIRQSQTEQRALIETMVVPETWFFRYPESFSLLTTQARALQRRLPVGQPLRLLSLPCSSGEEPYSMAIAMFDADFAAHEFQIDALDISQRVIEHATLGQYGVNAFRGDDPGIRERYFQREADGSHHIHDRLRAVVSFQCGNILDSIMPPSLTDCCSLGQPKQACSANKASSRWMPHTVSRSAAAPCHAPQCQRAPYCLRRSRRARLRLCHCVLLRPYAPWRLHQPSKVNRRQREMQRLDCAKSLNSPMRDAAQRRSLPAHSS